MFANTIRFSKSYFNHYKGLSISDWQGVFLNFFESIVIGVFYFLSVYFASNLQFGIAEVGYALSFHGIGAIAGSLLIGKLSDKFSPQKMSSVCLLTQGMVYVLFINSTSLTWVAFACFFLGASAYGFLTSNHLNILAQTEDDQRSKVLNLLSATSNLGISFSALFIGLAMQYGFFYIFMMAITLSLLLSIYLFKSKNTNFSKKDNKTNFSVPMNVGSTQNQCFFNSVVFACIFLTGIMIAQMSSTYPIYIKKLFDSIGVQIISYILILNTLFVITFQVPLGNYSSRYNKAIVVGTGSFLVGISMCLLNVSSAISLIIFACVVYSVGEILFFCTAQLLCYTSAPKKSKGFALGKFRAIYASSRAVGPFAGSYIYDQFGSAFLWSICGAVGLFVFVGCIQLRKN